MNEIDVTGVIFGMGTLVLSTVILVVVLHHVGNYLRERNERAADNRFADLVERYEQLASDMSASQSSAGEVLGDVRSRVVEIERMLREVE